MCVLTQPQFSLYLVFSNYKKLEAACCKLAGEAGNMCWADSLPRTDVNACYGTVAARVVRSLAVSKQVRAAYRAQEGRAVVQRDPQSMQ